MVKFKQLPIVVIALGWWTLTRPYRGISHDGLFYTAQALKRLYPEQYAKDVFFLYGSQDNFTLFSGLQAWLTGQLGVERAFLLLTVAGAVLWLYALLALLKRWLSPILLVSAIVLILSLDSYYAGFDLIAYGERFATPRIFSEALVLLALSWWLEGRRLIAYCAVAGATLLHPLIALAGIGVFAWAGLRARAAHPQVLWLVLLGAGLLGMQLLVWLEVSPWLDPFWRQLVAYRSPFVFPSLWSLNDWLRLALDASLLWLVSRYVSGEPGMLATWILPVLALAMLWALGAGVMGVQLAVAVQFQRVQWLAHLLAISLAAPLCLSLWRSSGAWDRYLAVGVGTSLVFPLSLGGVVLPIVYGLYRWARFRMPDKLPGRGLSLLLFVSFPLTGLCLWLFVLTSDLILAPILYDRPVWLLVLVQPPVAMGVFFAGYIPLARRNWGRTGLWVYASCLLLVGLLNWDVRKPWRTYDQPERTAAIAAVKSLIPPDAVVYWESGLFVSPDNQVWLDKGLEQTWFWLQRSHYASFDQAAGNVFFRPTGVEIFRRIAHLQQWGFRDDNLDWSERNDPPEKKPLTETRLRGVCSDPVLDYVITDSALPSARLGFRDPLTGRRFSVYACEAFRSGKS